MSSLPAFKIPYGYRIINDRDIIQAMERRLDRNQPTSQSEKENVKTLFSLRTRIAFTMLLLLVIGIGVFIGYVVHGVFFSIIFKVFPAGLILLITSRIFLRRFWRQYLQFTICIFGYILLGVGFAVWPLLSAQTLSRLSPLISLWSGAVQIETLPDEISITMEDISRPQKVTGDGFKMWMDTNVETFEEEKHFTQELKIQQDNSSIEVLNKIEGDYIYDRPLLLARGKHALAKQDFRVDSVSYDRLTFIDTESHTLFVDTHPIYQVVMGDGFAAWLSAPMPSGGGISVKSRNDIIKSRSNIFEIWLYRFGERDATLLYTFDNLNPNAPRITLNNQYVALSNYREELVLVDLRTKHVQVAKTTMFRLDKDNIDFWGNDIVLSASDSGSYHSKYILQYELASDKFSVIREVLPRGLCSWQMNDLVVSEDNILYWEEYADWCGVQFFFKKKR
jgi:hypothetical protein